MVNDPKDKSLDTSFRPWFVECILPWFLYLQIYKLLHSIELAQILNFNIGYGVMGFTSYYDSDVKFPKKKIKKNQGFKSLV